MRKVTKTIIIWSLFGIIAILLTRNILIVGTQPGTSAHSLVRDLVFLTNNRSSLSNNTVIQGQQKTKAVNPGILPKKTDGYNLAKRIHDKCNRTYKATESVFGSYAAASIQTCIIWKIGTTFLKRLYMMKLLPVYRDIINPYAIRFDKSYPPGKRISNSPTESRFLFVRDPYNRLLSGFVDKLLAPNPVYWKIIGVPAIRLSRSGKTNLDSKSFKCGHDLTFKEYVSFVISTFAPKPGTRSRNRPDGHFDRMTSLCKPCAVNYNFVGKMESFSLDAIELSHRLKMQNQTIHLLENEGYKYSWLDAIKDSAQQPFDKEFVKNYTPCISFYEALRRSWTKMQIRGLIGKEDFPKAQDQITNLTEVGFVNMAVKSREGSSSKERQALKEKHFIELFSTISIDDLNIIRTIYADDFKLFEYDDRPEIIFSRR